MSWFQQNAPPQQGSLASLGGVNQGYDWTSGTPDPNQPIYHAGSDLEMRQPGWNQGTPINGPQPVPGMPPQPMQTPFGPISGGGKDSTGMPLISDGYGNQPPPLGFAESPEHYQQKLAMWQQAQGNRGSGQPINQPMGPPIGYAEKPEDYQRRLASVGQQNPMLMPAGTGSLQSLGGGQLNQSGMVTLRGTDGTTKAVPQQDLAHWLSKGAVRV